MKTDGTQQISQEDRRPIKGLSKHGGTRLGAGRPKKAAKYFVVTVRLSRERIGVLDREARQQNLTRTELIREAVEFCYESSYANEFDKWLYARDRSQS